MVSCCDVGRAGGVGAARRGPQMKNTGKRIFVAGVLFVLSNAAILAVAGAFASQR